MCKGINYSAIFFLETYYRQCNLFVFDSVLGFGSSTSVFCSECNILFFSFIFSLNFYSKSQRGKWSDERVYPCGTKRTSFFFRHVHELIISTWSKFVGSLQPTKIHLRQALRVCGWPQPAPPASLIWVLLQGLECLSVAHRLNNTIYNQMISWYFGSSCSRPSNTSTRRLILFLFHALSKSIDILL